MTKRVLTDRLLKRLKPTGKQTDHWDAALPGFGARLSATGKVTFNLNARYPGSPNASRRSIGTYPRIGLAEAREIARAWLAQIARGIDPQRVEQTERAAEEARRESTFGKLFEEYLRKHVAGQRRSGDVETAYRRGLQHWANRPVTDIKRRDVLDLVETIAETRGPYAARLTFAYVRGFFSWAINRDIVEHSPCTAIRLPQLVGPAQPRERVLNDQELRAIWRASGEAGAFGAFTRFLLLTGTRRDEAAGARWSEFDLPGKVWRIPPERFKSNAVHIVPLSDAAMQLLDSLPRFLGGDYVFGVSTAGERPLSGYAKGKARLDAAIAETGEALSPWRLHDLRRTFRSRLSALRIAENVAELALGHARRGLQRIYDQHQYETELREAFDAWARLLRSIVEPEPDSNIVPLRAV